MTTPNRKPATRVFAHELTEANVECQDDYEKDLENQPTYHILPSGGIANRVATMGAITDIKQVKDSPKTIRARIVDCTGAYYIYASINYQNESLQTQAVEKLDELNPEGDRTKLNADEEKHIMVVGKPSLIKTDTEVYVCVSVENVIFTDLGTRERWALETAEKTLDRLNDLTDGNCDFEDKIKEHYTFNQHNYRQQMLKEINRIGSSTSPEAPTA